MGSTSYFRFPAALGLLLKKTQFLDPTAEAAVGLVWDLGHCSIWLRVAKSWYELPLR